MKRKAEETVEDTILPALSGEVKKTKTDISIDEKASSIRDCIKEEENEIPGKNLLYLSDLLQIANLYTLLFLHLFMDINDIIAVVC